MRTKTKSTLARLSKTYELLKKEATADARSAKVAKLLVQLVTTALDFLSTQCVSVPLTSKVPEKSYFSFAIRTKRGKISRPVNESLFTLNCNDKLRHLLQGTLGSVPSPERGRLLYTIAMAYCCATDLLKEGDQKTPATFFECLIGHLFAQALGVNPRTQVEVLRLEEEGGHFAYRLHL